MRGLRECATPADLQVNAKKTLEIRTVFKGEKQDCIQEPKQQPPGQDCRREMKVGGR